METFAKDGKPEGNSVETMSLKSLAEKALQRNQPGNVAETSGFRTGKPEPGDGNPTSCLDETSLVFLDGLRIYMADGTPRDEAAKRVRDILTRVATAKRGG